MVAIMADARVATRTTVLPPASPADPSDPSLAGYRANWGPAASTPSAAPTPSAGPTPSAAPSPTASPASPQPPVPSPSPGPSPVPAPQTASPIDAARVQAHAALAADVYNDQPSPPDGYRAATEDEVTALGLDPDRLDPGTDAFRARVYVDESGGYVVAFRGSQSGADWLANAQQGVGLDSDHYARALEIGRAIGRMGAEVTMTGHSLGGGLAATAGIAAGRPADTFNAAGLHDDTIEAATGIAAANGSGPAAVDNWRVPGEILTTIQEGGDRVAGTILGGIFGGPAGAAGGALFADAPPAYGDQHDLPLVRPEGVNWFEGLNVIDRHMMDWVLAGAGALR